MNRRLNFGLVYIIIGVILIVLNLLSVIDDYWSSFGIAILIVGVADIIRYLRYRNNSEYREKVDLSNTDERIRFLSMKAWSWAGYLFVMFMAVGIIVLQIAGLKEYSMICAGGMCLVLILFWLSYLVLCKKY